MPFLPYSVWDYVVKNLLGDRQPAFILMDDRGFLKNSGGNLGRFHLDKLDKDLPIEEQLNFLSGLFHKGRIHEAFNLDYIQMRNGISADIFGFPNIDGFWILFLDSSKSKEERREIQQRAYDLELSQDQLMKIFNKKEKMLQEYEKQHFEMDDVVYAAFMDLRGPLMNIQTYNHEMSFSLKELNKMLSDINIDNDTKNQLDHLVNDDILKAQHYVSNSIKKMNEVLKGLIKLSKIENAKPQIEPVDMNNLMNRILEDYSSKMKDQNISVEIKNLPPCQSDMQFLKLAFSKLIENSIKFIKKDVKGTIKIYGRDVGNSTIYSVEDNGIGIKEEETERVFKMFYRIDREGAEGEGLGLPFVKLLVKKLGGNVWMDSKFGAWTKVLISLPRSQDPSFKANKFKPNKD